MFNRHSQITSWFGRVARAEGRTRRPKSRRRVSARPCVERVEERCLLSYVLTDLGTLGGSYSSPADGAPTPINDNGQVIGLSATTGDAADHALLYSSGVMTDLSLGGGSLAYGLNDSGQVVGFSHTADNTGYHAFLYGGEVMTDLSLGGPYGSAYAINASGQVVGYSTTTTDTAYHAFLYSGGVMTDLGSLGSGFSVASGINDSGQVIGISGTTDGADHAFLYSGGVMTDLGSPLGGFSSPTAINASGQVVFTSYIPGYSSSQAFLYSGGVTTDLSLGGTSSFPFAINDSGQVIGTSNTAGDAATHAFLYSGGVMADLGSLGGTNSSVRAINASGQVIGTSDTAGDAATHAFLYSGVAMTDLGTLGGTNSYVWAMNNSGQVIGTSDTPGDAATHAFLYSGGVMTDLNDLIPAGSGVTIVGAYGINNRGQIAADAYNSDGQERAMLLTPQSAPAPSSLSGIVFSDFNNDGQVDFGEQGIAGVTINLDGTDDLGDAVHLSQTTDANGAYVFLSLRPGSYTITEPQEPAGFTQGVNSVGTSGGTIIGDQFTITSLAAGTDGLNYNFGERPAATGVIQHGQTAGIGFWNNKNGQALIKALNGGPTSTQLGDWLAATFPHMLGAQSGSNNLAGKTNAYVASFFQSRFVVKDQKLDAQVMATALAVYVTDGTLDNTGVGTQYGFIVSGNGVATATFNVGANGDAFGVANNTTMTVMDILLAADAQAVNGVLYNGNTAKRNKANNVFSAINQAGGI